MNPRDESYAKQNYQKLVPYMATARVRCHRTSAVQVEIVRGQEESKTLIPVMKSER